MSKKEHKKKAKTGSPSSKMSRTRLLQEIRPLDNIWVELLISSIDPMKKFTIRDPAGNVIYYGGERLENFMTRGKGRRFHMTILNKDMREVVNIYRKEVAIWMGCFCNATCMEQLKVTTTGERQKLLGTVIQQTKVCPGVVLTVKNGKGVKTLQLTGPRTRLTCCGLWPSRFSISDMHGLEVGSITEDTSSPFSHNYSISFPVQLDVKLKAVIVGVCFMISVRNKAVKSDGYLVAPPQELIEDPEDKDEDAVYVPVQPPAVDAQEQGPIYSRD